MSNPKMIPTPFAQNGSKQDIPVERLITDQVQSADYDSGFPIVTMTPIAAGGKAPRGVDFNGVLNDITSNLHHLQKGGRYVFDADFAAAVGGYPKGSVIASNDLKTDYLSLVDGNVVNPNTATGNAFSYNWALYGGDAAFLTRKEAIAAGVGADLAATNMYEGDLNLLVKSGEHYWRATAVPTQALAQARHAPTLGGGYMNRGLIKVWRENSNIVYQQFQSSGDTNLFIRYRYGDTLLWSPWKVLMSAEYTNYARTLNGYAPMGNGLIMQWGNGHYEPSDGSNGTVNNFSVAFPNTCLQVVCTDVGGASAGLGVLALSGSQYRLWARNWPDGEFDATISVRYLAIGY